MAINTSIVTAKAGALASENFKPSYAVPSAAITPATITAMVGLSLGSALQVAPGITSMVSGLQSKAKDTLVAAAGGSLSASARLLSATGVDLTKPSENVEEDISKLKDKASDFGVSIGGSIEKSMREVMSASSSVSSMAAKLMPPGNPAAFGQLVMQAQSHIGDAIELKTATNFISNTSFGDYGSGITSMSSLTTQGLDGAMGSLSSAAAAMSAAGPVFGVGDISNFGTDAGFIKNLASQKMANASKLNEKLIAAGVNPDDIANPAYASKVSSVMGSITDPKIIAAVSQQIGVDTAVTTSSVTSSVIGAAAAPQVGTSGIKSLKDFTDLSKIAPPGTTAGLTADLKSIGTKFSDMGASFKNPAAAADMLKNIEIPSIPKLNALAPSLSGLMGDLKSDIEKMTGTGNGPLGLPNIKDMLGAATGGPQIDAMNAALASGDASAISAAAANVNAMVDKSESLLKAAGIDIEVPTPNSLGSCMSFAQNLQKLGADTSGTGVVDSLKGMITNDKYGDAITASLAEGKNKMAMMANGIKPLDFSGGIKNPFTGLPSAGPVNSLGSAGAIMGGG